MHAQKTGWKTLTALCCLAYFASYLTRYDYAAVLVELVRDLHVPKTLASVAVTGSFITYGAGMLIWGAAADRICPQRLVALGLAGTAAINLAMGLLPNIYAMIAIWCFNGLFQAMLWPPLVRIVSENLPQERVAGAIALICGTAQAATVLVYLLTPALLRLGSWRTVFLAAGGAGALALLLWYPGTARLPAASRRTQDGQTAAAPLGPLVREGGLVPMMLVILLMGMLRDGLQTWMPTYIHEVFGLNTASSIFTSALLPALSVASIAVSMALLRQVRNEALSGGLFFGLGLVAAAALTLIFPGSPAVGVALFALLASAMHGVNQLTACSMPPHFVSYGRVATISGLLNCFVYVGAAISTYGFASFSVHFGWRFTAVCWTAIAALGTGLCLGCARRWGRFCGRTK